ncbi:hypothetical protein [Variovorax sp. Varisp62]|uniref:hypothetical protein n=1 Tax=Variovorax sp. Varisp62 TaxID=3243049 RepID=UPI0039B38D35
MGSYKSYKGIIKQAELMAMSPDALVAFLKKRASQSKDEWRSDEVDEDIEAALLARDDPAINLALAKHARFIATSKPLFTSGEPSGASRLAVLSNIVVGGENFSKFPVALFDDEEQTVAWLIASPSEELSALFENHNLDDSFLRDLLEGKKPWDQIPDDRLAMIVVTLHRNERMRRPYDDDFMDGYAEYSYGAVFNAAWTLAERVEPTVRWAAALNYLYDRLETDAFSIKKPLELAARWHVDPSDADAVAREAKDIMGGWLSGHQGVRKGLARLALSKDSKLLPILLASDDPALRSAAYADGDIKPEQLSAAYERDGELVFNQAMHNHKIWRTQAGRGALKTIAWAVVHADKHSDLLAANIFNGIRTDLSEKHPDWFKDEDDHQPELEASDEPATKADVLALSEMLAQPSSGQTLEQLKQSLAALNGRLGWVWWFSLGALATSLWRH